MRVLFVFFFSFSLFIFLLFGCLGRWRRTLSFWKTGKLRKCEKISESSDQQTFSVKGQLVNILGFVGHTVSIATTQLSRYREETDIEDW